MGRTLVGSGECGRSRAGLAQEQDTENMRDQFTESEDDSLGPGWKSAAS